MSFVYYFSCLQVVDGGGEQIAVQVLDPSAGADGHAASNVSYHVINQEDVPGRDQKYLFGVQLDNQ